MPIQQSYIDQVRNLVQQDSRVTACLMYGSFARDEGDSYSDVEFYLFLPSDVLSTFDRRSWCERIAPVEYSFVNEYGTFVVFFESLVRGEFHFESDVDVASVSTWIWELLAPEKMVIKDHFGRLQSALEEALQAPIWKRHEDGEVEQSERLLNWLLLATNVYERGEFARTLDALSYAHRFLLRGVRIREERSTALGKSDHWLNPTRSLEARAHAAVLERYAGCTSSLEPASLRSALCECWKWGAELAEGLATESAWRATVDRHPGVKALCAERRLGRGYSAFACSDESGN